MIYIGVHPVTGDYIGLIPYGPRMGVYYYRNGIRRWPPHLYADLSLSFGQPATSWVRNVLLCKTYSPQLEHSVYKNIRAELPPGIYIKIMRAAPRQRMLLLYAFSYYEQRFHDIFDGNPTAAIVLASKLIRTPLIDARVKLKTPYACLGPRAILKYYSLIRPGWAGYVIGRLYGEQHLEAMRAAFSTGKKSLPRNTILFIESPELVRLECRRELVLYLIKYPRADSRVVVDTVEANGPKVLAMSYDRLVTEHDNIHRTAYWKKTYEFPPPPLPALAVGEFYISPVTTQRELERVGRDQRHCVGAYSARVANGHSYIYTVSKGKTILSTIELDPAKRKLVQHKAKFNKEPSTDIKEAVRQFAPSFSRIDNPF